MKRKRLTRAQENRAIVEMQNVFTCYKLRIARLAMPCVYLPDASELENDADAYAYDNNGVYDDSHS